MITYLSIPYRFNPELSFAISNEIAAELMQQGEVVIAPISQDHPIKDYLPKEMRFNHSFWMKQDIPLVKICDKILVVVIGENGHQLIAESKGCQKEIGEAIIRQIPINYYQYDFNKE